MYLLGKVLAVFIFALGLMMPAQADYPTRPVTIVAPYGPGGSSDILGRVVAERLTEVLGANVLVENRPGAGSRIGTESVARANPDGYTLLLADMPFAIVPNLYADSEYDVEDFVAIAQIGVSPMVLFMRPDLEHDSLAEIIEMAQAEPEALMIGSGGVGATTHMVAELFQLEADVELLHVPFSGAGPSLQGLAGGQVDVAFSTYPTGAPLLEAGSIKALGVTSAERMQVLPEIETFNEAGYDLEVEHWWALLAPKDTPEEVVQLLREAAADVMTQDIIKERMEKLAVAPGTLSPEEFDAYMADESARWADIISNANIKIEE